jgi:secreted PhoX family phosphatase
MLMTATPERRPGRRGLPLVGALGTGSFTTCKYKCDYDCWHDAPNTSDNETFEQVVQRSVSRRSLLRAGAVGLMVLGGSRLVGDAAPANAGTVPPSDAPSGADFEAQAAKRLDFTPIEPSRVDAVVVPDGYASELLIRWGDPVLPGAPRWRFDRQTPEAQAGQFGYNNDYVAFMPLPWGSRYENSRTALLWVNHEYTNPEIMFADFDPDAPTKDQVDIQMNAIGGTVVEIFRRRGERAFRYRRRSERNRRITMFTPMAITGPAAGDELMRTSADPDGTEVLGTVNNCAGGVTPWGTVLTAEENFHSYFANFDAVSFGEITDGARLEKIGSRYGVRGLETTSRFERHYDRFDLAEEPNEVNRFGWVVEVDPYDPEYKPRKRTALGRMKHEGATSSVARDGRVAFYMGDDERFEYVYKFVTEGRFVEGDADNNRDLLDEGTLYVARFDVDAAGNRVGEWMPLTHGEGPLTEENGFADHAEVLINARGAADLLGATKMDRPEDIERNPVNGGVYIALTNNTNRGVRDDNDTPNPNDDAFFPQEGPANPRSPNPWGHVIELFEESNDSAATRFTWGIFLLCGDPEDPSTYFAGYDKSDVSPIAAPDNVMFDNQGNLWIATDGQPGTLGVNDAFHVVPISGPERGHVQQFLSVPVGAEACGPELTPDNITLFCAVQHPGDDGSLQDPVSNWPDDSQPPRPSVVSIARTAPGDPRIGS